MPWKYNITNSSSVPSPDNYQWSALNTLNQEAGNISIAADTAITQLKVLASAKTSAVNTRLILWANGSSVLRQSSTFSMSTGSTSVGGQSWRTQSITAYKVTAVTTFMVGLYRNPSGAHIAGTKSGNTGYRKTNTSSFPNVYSMSGYSSNNEELLIGVFYILTPNAVTSLGVTRSSDTKFNIVWTRNATADRPYTYIYIDRWDNVSNKYTQITKLTSGYTKYTDAGTKANRRYRWRIRVSNDAGYSSYAYSNYMRTTPAAPSSVTTTRPTTTKTGLTWIDNTTINPDIFRIQRRTSADNVTWTAYANYSTASGSALSWTDNVPANYNQYKIRAEVTTESTVTLASSYITSSIIYTIQPPNPPTYLVPNNNQTIDISGLIPITWQHNPRDGSAQTYFSIRFKPFGNAVWTLFVAKLARTESYSNVNTASFASGVWEYQVRTWGIATTGGNDTGDGDGDFSSTATFLLSTKPTVSITAPNAVDDYELSLMTVEWDYDDTELEAQQKYKAILYDSLDNILETKEVASVIASGGSDSMSFDTKVLDSATYKVGVQVQDSSGLWSEEDLVIVDVAYQLPPKPTISLTPNEDEGSIQIEIVNPVPAIGDPAEVEYSKTGIQSVYIDDYSPDTNFIGEDLDAWENTSAEDNSIILLDFDVSDFIGATIVSAVIRLYRVGACEHPLKSKVQYIEETWNQLNVTYNTCPTLDVTGYDEHVHDSEAEYEDWDITALMTDIADGSIVDYYGFAINVVDYVENEDYHYDIFNNIYYYDDDKKPKLIVTVEEETSEIDAEYNNIYRSIDGGAFELILEEVELNTTITDYTPGINNENTYYADAVTITPSINSSDEVSETFALSGWYFLNGGESYSEFVKLYKNTDITENLVADTIVQQFEGRTYPVKFQGDSKEQIITFSVTIDEDEKDDVAEILEYIGNTFYRDWAGRHFQCSFSDVSIVKQVKGYQYRVSCVVTRVENEVINLGG